jgi:hypothetical protein
LVTQPLPDDERAAIDWHVRELDRLAEDLALLDRGIAQDVRVAMETTAAKNRRAGASTRQDKIGSPVMLAADASRFATRSPAPDHHHRR